MQNTRDFCTIGLSHKNEENINEIIINAVQILDKKDLGNNIIRYDLVEPSPILLIDKIQINQVLLNILQNAIEAISETSKKQPKITIKTSISNNMLDISIADSGAGFSSDIQDQLFEPFFTTKPEGMGIGLTICRSIAEAHGGQLFAISKIRKGAEFTLTLPICEN